ncbi:hypothetical protein [Oricola sp.]|uniref:hypothetical protein n=1 Tax=Oricola sp. TaxID=1979950 RepID=UPI003BA87F20
MMKNAPLHERVKAKRKDVEREIAGRKSALEEAWRLSDTYSDIVPETYILPLDALAGFTSFEPPHNHEDWEWPDRSTIAD